MKNSKRLLAMFLIIIMLFSSIPITTSAVDDDLVSIENSDVELTADSALGSMLAQAINDETDISSSCSVTAIEFNGDKATVTYSAERECTLLVGVYDETTGEMLTYGKEKVYDFEKTATVSFENNELPEYFIVKAYLVDDKGAALCKNYVSYTYTQMFKENFTDVTVEDFDKEDVINLDDSYITNFAVIADKTEKIEAGVNSNILQSNYLEDEEYVFTNIDSDISSLKEGDVFWYDTGDDADVIIIKVKSIIVNGTTAIITPDKTSLDEVFDYIKIDESDDKYEMSFTPYYDESDENNTPVTYSAANNKKLGIDIENEKSIEANYMFGKDGKGWEINENVKVTGSVKLEVGATVKVYYKSHIIKDDYLQVEVSVEPSLKVEVSISAEMKDKVSKKIGEVTISPLVGLYIKFTPKLALKASAKIDISGAFTAKAGFEYNSIEGFVNKCESPSFKPEIKVEGEFFLGLDMTPHVVILHEKVADAGITAEVGFEIKAETAEKSDTHSCKVCLDGDIGVKAEVSAYVTFLNKFKPSCKILDLDIHLVDFYFSVDHQRFGWGICPYKESLEPVEYEGHYYYVFTDRFYSWENDFWDEAEEYCEKRGGHLAVITSAEENDFLYDYIISKGVDTAYIGLSDAGKEGEWKWVDGTELSYTNWHSGEPNGGKTENYAEFYYKFSNGKWNDGNCFYGKSTVSKPFICEWERFSDYKKHYEQVIAQNFSTVKQFAASEILNQNLPVSENANTVTYETAIEFTAVVGNIYMIYSVDGNKNVRYISQGTADTDKTVIAPFFKNADTDTYVVGDFGSGIISLQIDPTEHTHRDSDNDGKCDICGTEVGLTPTDPSTACPHICHKGGLLGLIWKIINFFSKLFRSNQYCACGVKHW